MISESCEAEKLHNQQNILQYDELLLEIFKFLDKSSLKAAALVCKQWNELIGTSPITMKNFIFRYHPLNGGKKSKRKHNNVDLIPCVCKKCDGFEFDFDFSTARSFRFENSHNTKFLFPSLHDLFPPMQHLTSLELYWSGLGNREIKENILMPSLKRLGISMGETNLLEFINAEQIVELKCIHFHSVKVDERYEQLWSFLKRAVNLKKLSLRKGFHNMFDIDNKYPFALSSFKSDCIYLRWDGKNKFFTEFLTGQRSSVAELNLDYQRLPEEIHKIIFNNLVCLKKFKFGTVDYLSSEIFLNPVVPLEELKINEIYIKEDKNELLKNLPELKYLTIDSLNSQQIELLAQHNKKLKMLTCPCIHRLVTCSCLHGHISPDLKLNSLETLSVNFEKSETVYLKSFLSCDLKIKKLEIKAIDNAEKFLAFFENIEPKIPLEHLKIQGFVNVMQIVFDAIKVKPGHLKILEITMAIKEDPKPGWTGGPCHGPRIVESSVLLKLNQDSKLPLHQIEKDYSSCLESVMEKFEALKIEEDVAATNEANE